MLRVQCLIITLFLASQIQLFAEVKPSTMFGDHMVLQRDMPVPVWGSAAPGEKIIVRFAEHEVSTKADKDGKWKIILPSLKASSKGRKMMIEGKNTIVFDDVLVGEVWICSGQSNMQFGWGDKSNPLYAWGYVPALKKCAREARQRSIRSYSVSTFVALTPEENVNGKWSTGPSGSAVAFGFSYYLNKKLNVPVAVIVTCWGSSMIEGWMPLDMTEELPHYKKMMAHFEKNDKAKIIDLIKRGKESGKGADAWPRRDNIYARKRPNILYNAMLHPLAPYACRGMVWYQGEANSRNHQQYAQSLPLWVKRLRKEWARDNFHFLAVMLPGFGRDNGHPTSRSWAWFRDAQMKVLELPYTGVANTIDLGRANNVHPADKAPVAERLALLAIRDVNRLKIVGQGPQFKSFSVKNEVMVINFAYADGLKTKDGNSPTGFWLAGKDGSWHQATASIKGRTVVLRSESIKNPVACRYGFAGKPTVNLVNGDNLPAYPFKTDDWSK